MKVFRDFVQDDSFVIKVSHDPAFDITGYVFDYTLKPSERATNAVLHEAYTAPADADAIAGVVYIPIPKTATSKVPPGEYYASLKRTTPLAVSPAQTVTILRSGARYKLDGVDQEVDKVTVYKTLFEKD